MKIEDLNTYIFDEPVYLVHSSVERYYTEKIFGESTYIPYLFYKPLVIDNYFQITDNILLNIQENNYYKDITECQKECDRLNTIEYNKIIVPFKESVKKILQEIAQEEADKQKNKIKKTFYKNFLDILKNEYIIFLLSQI